MALALNRHVLPVLAVRAGIPVQENGDTIMAQREPLNHEQRRLLQIAARMPLASAANLVSILGMTEDKLRRMLGSLHDAGWVASVRRGMTERR